MPKLLFSAAISLSVFVAPAGFAATVLERSETHTVEANGAVLERTVLRVRLDSEADVAEWSPYYIYLDENRELTELKAGSRRPDGGLEKLKSKDQDMMQVPGAGELHSSARYKKLEFPPLPAGSVLEIDSTVRTRPYFPAGAIGLTGGDATERLHVEVQGAGAGFRFAIEGDSAGLKVEPIAGGVRISASGLPKAETPEHAPGRVQNGPLLRYAWGQASDWTGIGSWYRELTASLPRADETVKAEARRLVAGLSEPRQKLAALTRFAQEKVRYVAVQIGIGGFRPFPPHEVLANRWGDCKGKSFLLIDLLAEAGIPAYPVLIKADDEGGIDPAFPAHNHFNHLIVAVPTSAVATSMNDAVAGGLLFLDPTLTRGADLWLHPSTQGQHALVVRPEGAELVETPISPVAEATRLAINLTVAPDGSGAGGVSLSLSGASASSLLDTIDTRPASEVESMARLIFSRLLPGVELGRVSWSPGDEALPKVSLTAAARLPHAVQGDTSTRSFALPGFATTPEPRHFSERKVPAVLSPSADEVVWKLHLPADWALPEPRQEELANELGSYQFEVVPGEGTVTVTERVTLSRRFVSPEQSSMLRELALAEHRTAKRRIRLGGVVNP